MKISLKSWREGYLPLGALEFNIYLAGIK